MRFTGKVAIVTGAATGIGREIAISFGREGGAVVVDYHGSPDPANAVVQEIEAAGGRGAAIAADVSDDRAVAELVAQTVARFGKLDILVNNAGVEKQMPFVDTPLDVWQKIISVNLTGPYLCCLHAAKQMVAQGGGGRLVNISSVHEDLPMVTNAPYCASKGGLRMLMRTIAVELAQHDITVNNVAPGAIETPMDQHILDDPQKKEQLLAEIPLRRMGKPADVAAVALFLASDEAKYTTGSTYFVDGGMIRQAGSL